MNKHVSSDAQREKYIFSHSKNDSLPDFLKKKKKTFLEINESLSLDYFVFEISFLFNFQK